MPTANPLSSPLQCLGGCALVTPSDLVPRLFASSSSRLSSIRWPRDHHGTRDSTSAARYKSWPDTAYRSSATPVTHSQRYPPYVLMDAFTTILSHFASTEEKPRADTPVESDNGNGSNGGGCTVAQKPVVDAPVDADNGNGSNGGGCIVA
ncbi:unnamed protein product [Peniophora sp. CBMAI 1063]|nr:unnamed protein product [Peniophora sp. CBMAI 1063]